MNLPAINQGSAGRLLYVNRDGARDLSAELRLYELSHADTDAGTEMPVIRENDLLTAASHLQAVPLDGRFRLMLRIYELGVDESQFRVRVYGEAEGVTTAQPIADFTVRAVPYDGGTFRAHPSYSEYGALTGLLNSPVQPPPLLRVDVEPLTAGSRYWTFVSVTNNASQRVTIVTPQ